MSRYKVIRSLSAQMTDKPKATIKAVRISHPDEVLWHPSDCTSVVEAWLPGTYILRRDIRQKYQNPLMNINSGMKFATKIEAETLHIMVKSGFLAVLLNGNEIKKTVNRLIREGFPACEYHKRVDVPGKHHVHLCHPENVSDHVTSFLNRPVRAGILQTRNQSAAKL